MIILYVFYGTFVTKSARDADIIRVIHKSIQQMGYR